MQKKSNTGGVPILGSVGSKTCHGCDQPATRHMRVVSTDLYDREPKVMDVFLCQECENKAAVAVMAVVNKPPYNRAARRRAGG